MLVTIPHWSLLNKQKIKKHLEVKACLKERIRDKT